MTPTAIFRTAVPGLRSVLHRLALAALVLLVAACATRTAAPVEERRAPPPRPSAPRAPESATQPPAAPAATPEADTRPLTYTVKRGDTLHAVALDLGLDYRDLAAWNNLENPNLIRVGQVLRVRPPGDAGADAAVAATPSGVVTAPLRQPPPVVAGEPRPAAPEAAAPPPGPRNADNYKKEPKALKQPYSEAALREAQRVAAAPAPVPTASPPTASAAMAPAPGPGLPAVPSAPATPAAAGDSPPQVVARADPSAAAPRVDGAAPAAGPGGDDKLDWLWPATGKLITGFSDTANLKGIDIAGKSGQPVLASAAGKVVYAGSGLRGYGKLVIVKHNDTYLSAYAHNSDILVKEGQVVARGQKIAEMGNTDSDQVKLHFEIRRQGKPVDPLKFLPPA